MNWKLTCACGWETAGSTDEVVAAAQEHGLTLHNMEVTKQQALEMAVRVED